MAKDLRSYIKYLEDNLPGELVRVKKPVDPSWEVSAFVCRLQAEDRYPAVLFENVQGCEMPILTNLFASRQRLAAALGTTPDRLLSEYMKREDQALKTRLVSSGPVKEVVKVGAEADLRTLPIVTHGAKDGGPYITPGVSIIKDPETGIYNAGIYRMMYKSPRRLTWAIEAASHAAHILRKTEKQGRDMEMVLALGHHPAMHLGSQSRVPLDVDELEIIGGLLGEPLEVVPCETIDLVKPAQAEIAIEGRVIRGVKEEHGPFPDFAWYMCPASLAYVFEVTAITHRRDAIFHDLYDPYIDHNYCGLIPREAILFKRVKEVIPSLKAVNLAEAGCCRFLAYVQIEKEFDGQGKNAALAALNSDPFVKIAIVVDEDVNIYNEKEVLWAVTTRTQPDTDVFFVPGAYVSPIDPSAHSVRSRSEKGFLNTKLGIDATKPVGVAFAERTEVARWQELRIEDYLPRLR